MNILNVLDFSYPINLIALSGQRLALGAVLDGSFIIKLIAVTIASYLLLIYVIPHIIVWITMKKTGEGQKLSKGMTIFAGVAIFGSVGVFTALINYLMQESIIDMPSTLVVLVIISIIWTTCVAFSKSE